MTIRHSFFYNLLANQFITVCVPVERHKCGDPSPLVVSQRGRCNWLLSGQKGTSTRTRTFGFHYVISIDRSVLYTLLKLGEGKKTMKVASETNFQTNRKRRFITKTFSQNFTLFVQYISLRCPAGLVWNSKDYSALS